MYIIAITKTLGRVREMNSNYSITENKQLNYVKTIMKILLNTAKNYSQTAWHWNKSRDTNQ